MFNITLLEYIVNKVQRKFRKQALYKVCCNILQPEECHQHPWPRLCLRITNFRAVSSTKAYVTTLKYFNCLHSSRGTIQWKYEVRITKKIYYQRRCRLHISYFGTFIQCIHHDFPSQMTEEQHPQLPEKN